MARVQAGSDTAPLLVLLLAIILCGDAFTPGEHPSQTLQRLQDEVYEQRWQEFPEYATFSGNHGYDDTLEAFTMEAFDQRKDRFESMLIQAENVDERTLSRRDRRDLRILRSYLKTFVEGYKWREYGNLTPINFLEGLTAGPYWPSYILLEREEDFQRYLKRMAAVPIQIDQQIGLMRYAIRLKRTNHRVSMDRVPEILANWKSDDKFFLHFQASLEMSEINLSTKKQLLMKGEQLVTFIDEAVRRMQRFIEKEYNPATRDVEGVHSLPNGDKYYRACLQWYLGSDISPEEIFALGVKEVDRIEREMKKIMVSVGYDGDLKSFFQYVKYIPKFYNRSKGELMQQYQELLTQKVRPRLLQLFRNISIPPLNIVPIETNGPSGSYGQNNFYVNLKEPGKRSTFLITPLALHEADPGHHFQEAYTSHFGIPRYRQSSIPAKLYAVPFHFPVYSAYAEGWALYAEYLGEEMGLYKEPYDMFGRYCSEIFRACRLVVDTGIHAFGWSRERAIRFLANYSDFPESQIVSEVDRYITWPGQACSYKIGEMKIKQLRKRAEDLLGWRFSVREFHHQVLRIGSVPLDILEEVVEEWIHEQLTGRSVSYPDLVAARRGAGGPGVMGGPGVAFPLVLIVTIATTTLLTR